MKTQAIGLLKSFIRKLGLLIIAITILTILGAVKGIVDTNTLLIMQFIGGIFVISILAYLFIFIPIKYLFKLIKWVNKK